MMTSEAANREAYNFWARVTRQRVQDPRKRDILIPLEPPHPYGAKRPSLEVNYFEQFNRDNIKVVNINLSPISAVVPDGSVTSDGTKHRADILVIANGYVSPTALLTKLGIQGIDGVKLEDIWSKGVSTYLGMMCHGFPNLFALFGPQAPGLKSNAPTTIEVQGNWIAEVIRMLESNGHGPVQPTKRSVELWREELKDLSSRSLYSTTESYYTYRNWESNTLEPFYYGGGIPKYEKELATALVKLNEFFVAENHHSKF